MLACFRPVDISESGSSNIYRFWYTVRGISIYNKKKDIEKSIRLLLELFTNN